jgi:glycosyltransferase involved in cell wall biosynthesis
MKKRLFIAIHYLELGGAEISLIGLLQALDYSKYDVDLFVYSHRGELMGFIPKEVNLLPEIKEYAQIERPLKDVIRDGYWKIAFARLKAKMQFRRYVRHNHPKDGSAVFQCVSSAVSPYLPSLDSLGEYDLAISFLTPHNIVLEKVNAKRKAAWIHTDYSRIDVNTDLELPVWSGFDHIVSISPEVTKAFVSRFPSLEPKIIEMENILSTKFVRERADLITQQEIALEIDRKDGETILLSVGRFCEAKNYDNVPDICRRIIAAGCPVKWYLIGYGGNEPLIRRKIAEAGMEDNVIILGKKANPYPYIKACDIYVQPSRYEGKSVTVREAQVLCKPVVITDYQTARSQVRDGIDGMIVPLDNEGCAAEIVGLIKDAEKQRSLIEYEKENDFGNEAESCKIDSLLN